jgi:hypothetical protein
VRRNCSVSAPASNAGFGHAYFKWRRRQRPAGRAPCRSCSGSTINRVSGRFRVLHGHPVGLHEADELLQGDARSLLRDAVAAELPVSNTWKRCAEDLQILATWPVVRTWSCFSIVQASAVSVGYQLLPHVRIGTGAMHYFALPTADLVDRHRAYRCQGWGEWVEQVICPWSLAPFLGLRCRIGVSD